MITNKQKLDIVLGQLGSNATPKFKQMLKDAVAAAPKSKEEIRQDKLAKVMGTLVPKTDPKYIKAKGLKGKKPASKKPVVAKPKPAVVAKPKRHAGCRPGQFGCSTKPKPVTKPVTKPKPKTKPKAKSFKPYTLTLGKPKTLTEGTVAPTKPKRHAGCRPGQFGCP